MNIINNNNSSKRTTKITAIATMAGIVAIIPAMLGGLINIGVSDVNVLSADCEQSSAQAGAGGKLVGLFSNQEQDCDVVDLL